MTTTVRRRPAAALDPVAPVQVLVATAAMQGARRHDEFGCVPGELVWIPTPCGASDCTCAFVFAGGSSNERTTTAEVVAIRAARPGLVRALAESMCTHCYPGARASIEAERLLRTAQRLPLGAVVERDGRGGIRPRQRSPW